MDRDDVGFLDSIDRIYSAVGRPHQWPDAIHAVCAATGADSGCLVSALNDHTSGNVGSFHNIDPDWIDAYNTHFHEFDPTVRLLAREPGRVHVDHVTGPRPAECQGAARAFYHEVMVPQGFRHTLHLGLSTQTGWAASVVLQRPEQRGPFGRRDVHTLDQLGRQLRRALQLHAELMTQGALRRGLSTALDHVPMGVLLLDGRGRVVHHNDRARRILADSPAVDVRAGRPVANEARSQQILEQLIRAAIESAPDEGHPLTLPAREGHPAVRLRVTPFRSAGDLDPLLPGGIRAAIWLAVDTPLELSREVLGRTYGLTPSEAFLLARLVEGWTQDQVAELRHVTRETVRSQLKSVMSKVGVNRQVDLVQAVLTGPAVIDVG